MTCFGYPLYIISGCNTHFIHETIWSHEVVHENIEPVHPTTHELMVSGIRYQDHFAIGST